MPGAQRLYIFFGGLAKYSKEPKFEFFRLTQDIAGHRIYVRDLERCYYHLGIRGVSNDIHSTTRWLQAQISETGCEEIYFIGNSMGAYAAIMFATLVGRGDVIAFAPTCYISPFLKLRHLNLIRYRQFLRMYRRIWFKPRVWDLRKLLNTSNYKPPISIIYDKNYRIDRAHVKRLIGFPNVSAIDLGYGKHTIIRCLKQEEKIKPIIEGREIQQVLNL